MLLLLSQNTFAQEKIRLRVLLLNLINLKEILRQTTTYEGNVMMKNDNISFENAEKVIHNPENGTYTIYHPKNFKILTAKSVHKTGKKEDAHVIIYNYREESVTF
ncbi:hypothetical protein [Chryseobacterium indoltheticum]|uniref:hypothetical protein n=1 Tax=Chryseobacterium indoltheticum TaxID=254 RepID=UPI003F498D87